MYSSRPQRPINVFISYRRDDSAGHAGRLFDRLALRYGRDHVFMDVTTIRPGVDYTTAIDEALVESTAVLVVIGKRWADAASPTGERRLDDPGDLVRLEIASALDRDLAVIPTLVHGASMPVFERLSSDLQPLARRHAIEIDDTRWDLDVERLVGLIDRTGVRDDLFISHSSSDHEIAAELRDDLESAGYRCWMAPDGIRPGAGMRDEQIVAAIDGCRAFVLLISARAATSDRVLRELNLAFGRGKPVVLIRLEPVTPTGSLDYLLSLIPRIDAFPPPLAGHLPGIRRKVEALLGAPMP